MELNMSNEVVKKYDLRDRVYNKLKEAIKEGNFEHSYVFMEVGLANKMGVSRTPVREALAMLVRDGVLVQKTKGFTFPSFSSDEICQILEVRELLEPFAIREIVEKNSLDDMRDLILRLRSELVSCGASELYISSHSNIRGEIFSKLKNKFLMDAIYKYEDSIHYLRIMTLRDPDVRRNSYSLMCSLLEALEKMDAHLSQEIVINQIKTSKHAYLSKINQISNMRKDANHE